VGLPAIASPPTTAHTEITRESPVDLPRAYLRQTGRRKVVEVFLRLTCFTGAEEDFLFPGSGLGDNVALAP
jgi:hypothetical protein